jgi:hypothetical protein
MTAPPDGLCLREVVLDADVSEQWPYHLDGEPADAVLTSLD